MKTDKIIIICILFLLISNFFASSAIIQIKKKQFNSSDDGIIVLPEWNIGNYWKYNMNFIFEVEDFDVDAEIKNMYTILTNIDNIEDNQIYVLSLNGDISGDLSFSGADIEIADFSGDFDGYAYIGKNELGIKKFEFFVDGKVKLPIIGKRDMYFEMTMDFDPCFDFLDFPINLSEQPWEVQIDEASLDAYVNIDVPFGEKEYHSSIEFNDTMNIDRTETVNGYDSVVIQGEWGYLSELYYAKDVGYLVKVDEGFNWGDEGINAVFHLNLLETNYDVENLPPNPPNKPVGEKDGKVKEEYSYKTKTVDPNQDDVYYMFDWGDGTFTDWLGPYPSGTEISTTHKWYNKGAYSVTVKAKDENGIQSSWSEPLSVIIKGDPKVNIKIHRIEKKDEIEWGTSLEPEWYYEVALDGSTSPPKRFHDTDDGTYNGEWNHNNNWQPDKTHIFKANNKEVVIKIKLMDYDDFWEGGDDDLADISGCDHPNTDGKDDIEGDPNLPRGAIYHGTYNLVTDELKPYNKDHTEDADFVYEEDGYYITCGDYKPDSSTRYENGIKDPENDAKLYYKIEDDYKCPQVTAEVKDNDGKLRPLEEIQFIGKITEGAPDYYWSWDFGDGETSTEQNPKHIYQNKGTYTVQLTATDKFGEKDSSSITLTVENKDPILTNDKVERTGEGGNNIFTFSVHYFDPDQDEPSVKKLIIDNNERTLSGSGHNSYYSLQLKGKEIGRGKHTFYFYFEDGHGGVKKTSEKSFNVRISKNVIRTSMINQFFKNYPAILKVLEILY